MIPFTGCKSDIWKKVQVDIYCINIASNETNDVSKGSSRCQLYFDSLKVGCHALMP